MLALIAVLLVGRTSAQDTVYRWTDENGTVHFADVPPAHVNHFTTEELPAVPPPARAAAGEAPPAAADAAATPMAEGAPSGPARVVLKDKQAVAVGPSVQAFRGKVKNEGGDAARDIFVGIVVTEPVQGAECLRNEIDVEPSTLRPGEEGTFDAEFDNPCFHGPTDANLKVEWR